MEAGKGPASHKCHRNVYLDQYALSARRADRGKVTHQRSQVTGLGPRAQTRLTSPQAAVLLSPTSRWGKWRVPADGAAQGTASLLLQKPLLSCVPHCYARDVSRLCHLSPGTYRIVPSTYLPDTEGTFTVTIATRIDRKQDPEGDRAVLCHRRSIHSQEMLGQLLQEASFMAVMKT